MKSLAALIVGLSSYVRGLESVTTHFLAKNVARCLVAVWLNSNYVVKAKIDLFHGLHI